MKTSTKINWRNSGIIQTLLVLFFILSIGLTFQDTFAQKTWTGTNSTIWSDAGNWSPAILPTTTDNIVIPTIPTGGKMPTLASNNYTILSLTIQTGATLTQTGGSILINGGVGTISGIYNQSGGTFFINNNMDVTISSGGQLTVSGTGSFHLAKDAGTNPSSSLVINGSVILSNGNIDTKTLTIPTGKTFTQTGGTLFVQGGAGSISGTYNQSGGNFFIDNQPMIVNSGGQLNLSGTATFHMAKNLGTNPQQTLTINGSLIQSNGTLDANNIIIGSVASYSSTGGTTSFIGNLTNSGTVTLNSGTINVVGNITNNVSSNFSIAGATVTSQSDATNFGSMSVSSGAFKLQKTDGTPDRKITIDGGTFNQSGGTVSTKDMELKNGGIYNQTNGEFQISRDLKVPAATPINSFNGTGGTVHFLGAADGGADYTGNVQFYNVLLDATADYNSDNNSDNIKISGNFTNNNPSLNNDKGVVTFNGTSPQTISSLSNPADTKNTFGNLVVSNPTGVTLLTDVGVKASFSYNSGGYLIKTNGKNFYVNGAIYTGSLPVELTSFSASVVSSAVKLNWATATEVNNYGFEIERQVHTSTSLSVTGWEKIGFVNGNGNSNSPKSYSFEDKNVTSGKYSYRLKQIDNDGKFEYSKIVEIEFGASKTYGVSQNYPNPFNPSTVIRYQLPGASFVTLKVYDAIGNEVATLVNEHKDSGDYQVEFNGSNLPSGMYIYQLNAGKFVITKKMILLK